MKSKKMDDAIRDSGLKIGFIVKELGISRQAFDRKRKGEIKFNDTEKQKLISLLNISPDIFLP